MGEGVSAGGVSGQRRGSGAGGAQTAQQCRVHLHRSGPDGGRPAPDPGVPHRQRGRGRIHQYRQRPGDVSRPAAEVSRRRQGRCPTRRAVAGWLPLFPSEDPARLDRRDTGRDPPVLRPVRGGPETGSGFGGGERQRPRQYPHRAGRSPAAARILCGRAGRAGGAALRPQDGPIRGSAVRAECQVPRQAVDESQRSHPLSPSG